MANAMFSFIKAAIQNPLAVSTVFPTSRSLAENLLDHADLPQAKSVVELGAGTGAITQHLIPRLSTEASYIGIELDGAMVDFLKNKKEFSGYRFEKRFAEEVASLVSEGSVDVVVSSLPWTMFNVETQRRTIDAIQRVLKPGGVFLTYICFNAVFYPSAATFLNQLRGSFTNVRRSSLEWRNIPPAYVFRASR